MGVRVWRKGWDSNPRWAFTHDGFQDRCLKPLGHPSVRGPWPQARRKLKWFWRDIATARFGENGRWRGRVRWAEPKVAGGASQFRHNFWAFCTPQRQRAAGKSDPSELSPPVYNDLTLFDKSGVVVQKDVNCCRQYRLKCRRLMADAGWGNLDRVTFADVTGPCQIQRVVR